MTNGRRRVQLRKLVDELRNYEMGLPLKDGAAFWREPVKINITVSSMIAGQPAKTHLMEIIRGRLDRQQCLHYSGHLSHKSALRKSALSRGSR